MGNWLAYFVEVLLTSEEWLQEVRLANTMKHFPKIHFMKVEDDKTKQHLQEVIDMIKLASHVNMRDCLDDLIELGYADVRIAYRFVKLLCFTYSLWVMFFPLSWSFCTSQQQMELSRALSQYFANDLHYENKSTNVSLLWEELDSEKKPWSNHYAIPFRKQEQSAYGTTPVSLSLEAVLEGIIRCDPQPTLSPTLLLFVASHLNCGPQVSVLLETGLKECTSAKDRQVYQHCLDQMYDLLNEKDASVSSVRSLPHQSLHNGVILERYNKFQQAQACYMDAMSSSESDMDLHLCQFMQERWKLCTQNLGQWNVLFEYARMNEDFYVMARCFFRNSMWQ